MPKRNRPTEHTLAQQVLIAAREQGIADLLLNAPLVVGVSGGADSLALLYILCELRGDQAQRTLHVAHLDHGFRGEEAQADADFVEKTARSLGLGCTIEHINVPHYAQIAKMTDEEAARTVRYAFLSGVALEQSASAVAVAHNADDQVETVLMHLLRGSGLQGVAGMSALAPMPPAASPSSSTAYADANTPEVPQPMLYRPLLGVWRRDIEAYCRAKGLVPRIDPTNADLGYTRNLVRHKLLPELEQVAPGVSQRLETFAQVASADNDALDLIAQAELVRLTESHGEAGFLYFDIEQLTAMPLGLQRRVVRLALQDLARTTADIELEHVERARAVLLMSPGAPASAALPHALHVTADYFGRPAILRVDGTSEAARRQWEQLESLWPLLRTGEEVKLELGTTMLAGGWQVEATVLPSASGEPSQYCALFDAGQLPLERLVLRGRRAGDRIVPFGMEGSRSLQDLYVDAKIPKALRDRAAVLALQGDGEVLWVPGPGGRRSAQAPLTEQTGAVLRVIFTPSEKP